MAVMPRYTLYRSHPARGRDITRQIRSAGARVIAWRPPGLALIDASDKAVRQLRSTLPEWRITKEATARIPRPRPKLPR
jgi:hypothetical protein